MYKLHERETIKGKAVRGLSCDESGVFLGGDCALITSGDGANGRYRVRDINEINRALSSGYGRPVDLSTHLPALGRLAELMSDGQWGAAQIAALHLRLPELPDDDAVERLLKTDQLLRFNPNHRPAGPGGGQFASGSEDDGAQSSGGTGTSPAPSKNAVPRLSIRTTAGAPNTVLWGTQFHLSHPSKMGGFIVQRVDITIELGPKLSSTSEPFWEAFEVKPGATMTSYVGRHPVGGGDDAWRGAGDGNENHGVDVTTGTARFYEGLTVGQLKAHGFAFASVGSVGGRNQYNTVNDPHLPTNRASNEVKRASRVEF